MPHRMNPDNPNERPAVPPNDEELDLADTDEDFEGDDEEDEEDDDVDLDEDEEDVE